MAVDPSQEWVISNVRFTRNMYNFGTEFRSSVYQTWLGRYLNIEGAKFPDYALKKEVAFFADTDT